MFLTDPDKSDQTKERQAVEVRDREGGERDQVCCTPLLGDCDFNEHRLGGERQRRRAARWSGAHRYFAGWMAGRAVGGVAEGGRQGTLVHRVSACVCCSPHKSSLADPEGISGQCLRTDLRGD